MLRVGFARGLGVCGRTLATATRTLPLATLQRPLLMSTLRAPLQFPKWNLVQPVNVLQPVNPQPVSQPVEEPLGEDVDDKTVHMDSVLRKRRLKMKKHKLRKRRRTQRALMKRLGKL